MRRLWAMPGLLWRGSLRHDRVIPKSVMTPPRARELEVYRPLRPLQIGVVTVVTVALRMSKRVFSKYIMTELSVGA